MTQVQKVRTGKWASDLATAEEMTAKVAEVKAICEERQYMDRVIHPYGFGIKLDEFLGGDGFRNYRAYTHSSKQILIAELNGFIDILNHWIAFDAEKKVTIRFVTGNKKGEKKDIPASCVQDYIDSGIAELA